MLIIRIFLLVAFTQKLFAMEEPLPDWLKVYQQNNIQSSVESSASSSDAYFDSQVNTIGEVRRVLKPGGTFMLTMLSKRRLKCDQEKLSHPREISRNTWVFDDDSSDKRHPHYYCGASEMLALFQGFEVISMEDREHDKPGSWHWHLILERQS